MGLPVERECVGVGAVTMNGRPTKRPIGPTTKTFTNYWTTCRWIRILWEYVITWIQGSCKIVYSRFIDEGFPINHFTNQSVHINVYSAVYRCWLSYFLFQFNLLVLEALISGWIKNIKWVNDQPTLNTSVALGHYKICVETLTRIYLWTGWCVYLSVLLKFNSAIKHDLIDCLSPGCNVTSIS